MKLGLMMIRVMWKLGANRGMPKPTGKMMPGGMTKLGGMTMTWKDSISTCEFCYVLQLCLGMFFVVVVLAGYYGDDWDACGDFD